MFNLQTLSKSTTKLMKMPEEARTSFKLFGLLQQENEQHSTPRPFKQQQNRL
jgi:hypothetical protein